MTETIIRDDFAGPGGWEEGLRILREEYGITHDRCIGYENEPHAVATAIAAGQERVLADVRRIVHARGLLSLYIASPPCQTFSAAGNGKGRLALAALRAAAVFVAEGMDPATAVAAVHNEELDERSVLALHPLTVIRDSRPQAVALEQVPQVLPLWEVYAEIMAEEFGYSVRTGYVYSEQYGVPQARKRAVLVAVLDGEAPWPTPTHSRFYSRSPERLDEGVPRWLSMAEGIEWGMTGRPSFTVTGGGTETGGAEIFGNGARKGMRREIEAGRWKPVNAIAGEGEADVAWVYDRPSPTIVGSYHPEVVAKPGYRKAGDPSRQNTPGSVRVTVAEAGVLQSFRADYAWQGKQGKQFQQIGNAMPPRMAAAILLPLLER